MGFKVSLNLAQSQLIMKFLVLFACVAAASAQLVTYPNGAVAPAKTPEVQAAEAAHFAAKGAYAYAPGFYNGYYAGAWNGAYPYNFGYAGYPGYYNGYFGGLVARPNGAVVPVDEPAVAAAKAEHFAAHGLPAAAPVAPVAYAAGYPGLVPTPTVPSSPLNPLMS